MRNCGTKTTSARGTITNYSSSLYGDIIDGTEGNGETETFSLVASRRHSTFFMNSYCAEESTHLVPMHVWAGMIVILLVLHQAGVYFLEEKCLVLSPPAVTSSKHESRSRRGVTERRPAVYLVRIMISIAASYLLVPVAIHFYIPSLMAGVQALLSHYNLWNGGEAEQVEVILPKQSPSWVCNAEQSAAMLHCANLIFEMIFVFQMKQRSEIILHHFASICYMALRLTNSHIYFGSQWLWLALGWHLCVYSVNFIRSCYSFISHYLDDTYRGGNSPLKSLFHCTNCSAWVLILFGYSLAMVFDGWNGDIIGGFIVFVVVAPLCYGSSKEIFKNRPILRGSMYIGHLKTVSSLLFEMFIGLIVVPPLLFLLAFIFRGASNNFTKKTSHKNTAGGVVSLRALCNAQSDRRLHINDPYAVLFVEGVITHLILKSEVLCYLMCVLLETRHPGALGHLITRTQSIDEIISDLSARDENPIRQLVILGAGYDTRPYRLETLQDVAVFEVDQKFMSSEKQAKCANLSNKCKELVHLSVDFNNEDVSRLLLNCAKFDPLLPTLFLWEGVQVYLPDESVDR